MKLPLTVLMITYNEEHYIYDAVRTNLDYVESVIILDSFSTDNTVKLATEAGAIVYQRKFKSFGDQWNFAAQKINVTTDWVMKMDPDEKVDEKFWKELGSHLTNDYNGISVVRRLWFLHKPLVVRQKLVRCWRKDTCHFQDVKVNEHPIVKGRILELNIEIQHHDSPHLHHWLDKQNIYTSLEARARLNSDKMAFEPNFFGNADERRMFFKKNYHRIPCRHYLYFAYCLFILGAYKSGRLGLKWAQLRKFVFQMRDYKYAEMNEHGDNYPLFEKTLGDPSPLAIQCNE